jgi:hypothetical protein
MAYHLKMEVARLLRNIDFFYHFYLQAVQLQVHLANGVMGGEAGRGAPISTPL